MFYETIIDSDIDYKNVPLNSDGKVLRMASRGIVIKNDDSKK